MADGKCVIGSIAAALQVKFGYPDATAIAKAEAALKAAGVDITTWVDGGLSINTEKIANALKALGFNVFKPIGGEYNANQIALHFGSNGFGVGYIDGNPGHSVFLTGYKSPSNTFTYYDSVKGGYGSRTGMDGIWLFFN